MNQKLVHPTGSIQAPSFVSTTTASPWRQKGGAANQLATAIAAFRESSYSALEISAPLRVIKRAKSRMSMLSLIQRTEPSPMQKFAPPEWNA
jgi:hypothetical protein